MVCPLQFDSSQMRAERLLLRASVVLTCGLTVGLVADTAWAACIVTDASNDPSVPGTLPNCVDQGASQIDIQVGQPIELDKPLLFTKLATVTGPGTITHTNTFSGDYLIEVGENCQGGCSLVALKLSDLELMATSSGVGGIDVRRGHVLELSDALLHDFTGLAEGGGVRAQQQSALTIHSTEIHDCEALDGGAVWSEAADTKILGSFLHDNTAQYNGGAVKIGSGNFFTRALIVEQSTLSGNNGNWGGAIQASAYNIVVTVKGSSFSDNVATTRGGALHGKGEFFDTAFEGNQAASGGALYLVDTTTVQDSTFESNEAVEGGGITLLSYAGGLLLDRSTLKFNTAQGPGINRGGGLYVGEGMAHVTNSTFSENSAHAVNGDGNGGAVSVTHKGEAVLEHATLWGNQADIAGGIATEMATHLTLHSSYVADSGPQDCEIDGAFYTETSMDTDGTCGVGYTEDPGLQPLAPNGGVTETHMPSQDYLGLANCYLAEDQHQDPRPSNDCDIGSVQQ